MRRIFHLPTRTALVLLLFLALGLSACSPYRVHKRAPTHGKANGLNFLDFRRSSCGCN